MARQGRESRGELVECCAHGGGPGVDSRRPFGEAPKRRGNLNRNGHVLSPGSSVLQSNSVLAPTGLPCAACPVRVGAFAAAIEEAYALFPAAYSRGCTRASNASMR